MKTWISFASFSDELLKIAAEKVPLAKADHQIFRELMRGAPVKVRVTPEAAEYGGGYFDQVKKEIAISDQKFETLAHELGHAELDKHLLGRMLQSRVARIVGTGFPNVLSGVGAGLLVAKGKKWGLLLPSALAAPTILSEILATRKGGKLLEEAGASEEQHKSYRKTMSSGLSTYFAAPALATFVASAR